MNDLSEEKFYQELDQVENLKSLINEKFNTLPEEGMYLMMEYLLHALSEYSYLSKTQLEKSFQFGDLLSSMFSGDID